MNHWEEFRRTKYARGDLDAQERRDNKLIKEHLNEAPGKVENGSWKDGLR